MQSLPRQAATNGGIPAGVQGNRSERSFTNPVGSRIHLSDPAPSPRHQRATAVHLYGFILVCVVGVHIQDAEHGKDGTVLEAVSWCAGVHVSDA